MNVQKTAEMFVLRLQVRWYLLRRAQVSNIHGLFSQQFVWRNLEVEWGRSFADAAGMVIMGAVAGAKLKHK
jgi:hypothetical protein